MTPDTPITPEGLSAEELALLAEWSDAQASEAGDRIQAGPAGADAPLSYAQERVWFLERLHTVGPTYHLPCAYRLRGALNADALARSLAAVVARHAALRSVVVLNGQEPEQHVVPEATPDWAVIDLTALAVEPREVELTRRLRLSADRPFDLATGPLLRAELFRLADDEHVLLVTLHHLVADEWSLAVLWRDLAEHYAASGRGRSVDLKPLPVQYGDYARWQRTRLASGALDGQLEHWRKTLAGRLPVLDLPADRSRPPEMTYRGGQVRAEVETTLFAALKALGRGLGATPFVVMLSALFVLLHRLTGQTDLTIGFPTAGRVQPELEDLIGYFANTLVVRARVDPAMSFAALIAQVREAVLEALAHQEVPFERLVEVVRPERDPSRNPLFQVMLAYQNVPNARPTLEGLRVEPLTIDHDTAKFDLLLTLNDVDEAATGWLEYNSALFDIDTAERMVERFLTLLRNAVARPDVDIADLEILTPARRTQIVDEWNATAVNWPEPDATLIDLLEAQADRTPNAPAIGFEGAWLTYAELHNRAAQLARHLQDLGVGPDVRVGICAERSIELVVALLAVLKAGGAYVPLDPGYPPERLAYMIADARVPVLLTQARLALDLPQTDARLFKLDADWPDLAALDQTAPPRAIAPRHLAYMIYTSGSTGRPKGAMNQHDGIVNRLRWMQAEYALTTDDCVLQKTPFSFDVSVWEFFWPLMVGARLVLARPDGHKDPAYLIDTIARERVTTLHFVPSMLQHFVEGSGLDRCAALRRVICSGEALPFDLQQRFFARLPAGVELHNLYGPTEAAVDVSAWACTNDGTRTSVPIGRPIANTRLYVLDARLRPVPIGVAGELYIAGVQVGRGYLGRPDLTAERYLPDPYAPATPGARMYRTGDLARHLADGAIEYLGRVDHQIKLRGFRIELGEIEAALVQHPAVREAVVIARREANGEPQLVAYVVPAARATTPTGDLRRHLAERLPEHMLPGAFVELPALPLNPSGKVDRAALPAPVRERTDVATLVSPRSRLELTIAAVWREALALETLSIHDNFFELGGHSLLLLRVHARLREALGRDLALMDLFRYPTIAALAQHLDTPADRPIAHDPNVSAQERARLRREAQQTRRRTPAQPHKDPHA